MATQSNTRRRQGKNGKSKSGANRGAHAQHGRSHPAPAKAQSRPGQSAKRGGGHEKSQDRPQRRARDNRETQRENQGSPDAQGGGGLASNLLGSGTRIVDTVRQYPLPSVLIGAGLAWLAYEGSKQQNRAAIYERAHGAIGSVGEGLSHAAESVKDGLSQTAEFARKSYGGVAESARERSARLGETVQSGASRAADALREGASAVGQGARRTVDYGRETVSDLAENHTLALGLGLLAVGVAAAMMLPSTRLEQSAVGQRASKLMDRMKTAGGDLLAQGKELASKAVEEGITAATEEADLVGLTPQKLARKVKRVAGRIQDAVTHAGE
jgi:hypothetical protein